MEQMHEETFEFIIEEEHAGLRADGVLSSFFEDLSRSRIQKLMESGFVSADGEPLLSRKQKLKAGTRIVLRLPEENDSTPLPENISLDVVYEDESIIVVNKPVGMVVHPAPGNRSGTLVNALLARCGRLSGLNGPDRPGIVHRIDKDTSGLLVCAKDDDAHAALAEQLADRSMLRSYRALCFYGFSKESGTIDAPIGRSPSNRLKWAVVGDGRPAVTHWKLRERFNGFTELDARLQTGRTHQIRVHLAYIDRPVLGDPLYGPKKQPYTLSGQMLHAERIGFVHPKSGEYMEFCAEPPEEYLLTVQKLRNRK